MAKYDPQWDRVVRAIRDHYVMYDKVREINIRQEELSSDIYEAGRLKQVLKELQKKIARH